MLERRVAPDSLLVDVGGGTGVGAEEAGRLAPPGTYRRRVVVDPQRGMLTGLRSTAAEAHRLDPVVADAVRLPFEAGSFDVVLSLGVLCCMTDEAVPAAVAETWRVLRPGGLAVVTVPLRRGDADDPILRAHGFVRLANLRPGRSLYQRPDSEEVRTASPPA